MDFSVRQLDSTQRRCVLNKDFGHKNGFPNVSDYYIIGNISYICEVDGMYEISITSGHNGTAYCYHNSKICCSAQSYIEYYDNFGDYVSEYHRKSSSVIEYCSKGDVLQFNTLNQAIVYLTPYK